MLNIKNLSTTFFTEDKTVKAVRNVNLQVSEGEFVSIVGESGCGKSTLALSILNLIDPPGKISGSINFKGKDILKLRAEGLQEIRGKSISMIFQDPFSSLNPVLSVGEQIVEVLQVHEGINADKAKQRAIALLKQVKIKEPAKKFKQYPHEFSGGMKQRIMIAMAIATKPKLLIADEPTTALDVITGREIIQLLLELRKKLGMAIILITHNIALAAEFSDRFYVMYAGEIVEQGGAEIIKNSRNPYTYMLLRCLPELYKSSEKLSVIPGRPPDMSEVVKGCTFSVRCKFKKSRCEKENPDLCKVSGPHFSRCLRIKEINFNE